MKKKARVLLEKSIDSLVLSIDHFNRPWDRGRQETVLILLDRAFELLLKAAIVHQDGRIREAKARETIGFDKCVRKCLSDVQVRCLDENEAITIQMINSLRDAAQHYILDISEDQLYLHAQAGVTLYGGLLQRVFSQDLSSHLPERALPVAVNPPRSLEELIETEIRAIRELVKPGSRRRLEARAKLRSLAILEDSLAGVRSQPSARALNNLTSEIGKGRPWRDLFPGVASLRLETKGTGLGVSIRLSKSEGEPVHLVPEGTPGATVVAIKKVDSLGFYNLGLKQIAKKLGLTEPKTLALVRHLDLQSEIDCFKEVKVGKSIFKRYSQQALRKLFEALPGVDIQEVWRTCNPKIWSARES